LTAPWPEADAALVRWVSAHAGERELISNPGGGLLEIYKNILRDPDRALADGPLILLLTDVDDTDAIQQPFFTGRLPFALAAPVTDAYQARPTRNVAEWTALRQRLAEDVLGALHCQLWHRQTVVDRLADYLEVRGIAVQSYRAETGEREPDDRVGISPEK